MWTPAEVVLAEGSAEWFCSGSWAAEGCRRVLLSLHEFVTKLTHQQVLASGTCIGQCT